MREGRFNHALSDLSAWARRALTTPVDWTPHLKALQAFARTGGSRLLLVYMPTRGQVTDRYLAFQAEYSPEGAAGSLGGEEFQAHARWLARSSQGLGIPFLDLSPALRELEADGPELYWRYDDHLRPRGYRAAGEQIAEWFLSLPRPASPRRAEPRGPRAPGGRGRV